MTINVKNGDIVSFSLVQANIINNDYTNVTVLGQGMFDVARGIDPELRNKHYNLYPYFKDKVNNVDDPNYADGYLILKLSNGELSAIGVPWINEDTFEVISGETRVYTFPTWKSKYESSLHELLANLGAEYSYTSTKK